MAYRAGGDILVRWTHVDIECVRLHVWSWLVDDFGQSLWPKSFSTSHDHSSIQAGPLVGNTWRLALNKSLKQWEFGGEQAQVLATSVTVILPAALCVSPAEAAFRMTSSHWMGLQKPQGLMKHLPCCALCPHTLTFGAHFDQGLHHVRLPEDLQRLTCGDYLKAYLFGIPVGSELGQFDMASRR